MKALALVMAACLMPAVAVASIDIDIERVELEKLLRSKIRTVQHMALNPLLIRATRRQNAQSLELSEIEKRDDDWRESKGLTGFKRSLQQNSAGKLLKRYVARNDAFNEAFLTDNQGANVAAFPATSDYWQGDEEKWSESFNDGDGKIFLGPLELDQSTNIVAVQVSAPVLYQGETIGVLVVGVTVDYLTSKQQ